MKHIMAILISVFSLGYHGKTIDFEKYSPYHRTTVAHFLNKRKWDDARLEDVLKSTVIQCIYKEAQRSGKPVFCIVDDTISSKTKPSSQALHPIEDAVVLISYPKDAFHIPKALRAFISTDVSLSTQEILDGYVERWPVEVFFRQSKNKLAFDKYQVRSSEGIRRYWLLMSLAHLIACTGCGRAMSFEEGYAYIYNHIEKERLQFIYQCGARHVLFEDVLALVA